MMDLVLDEIGRMYAGIRRAAARLRGSGACHLLAALPAACGRFSPTTVIRLATRREVTATYTALLFQLTTSLESLVGFRKKARISQSELLAE